MRKPASHPIVGHKERAFSFAEGDRIQLSVGITYSVGSISGATTLTLSTGDVIALGGITSGFTSDWVVFG